MDALVAHSMYEQSGRTIPEYLAAAKAFQAAANAGTAMIEAASRAGEFRMDGKCDDQSGMLVDARHVRASLVEPRMSNHMLNEMEG